MSCHVSFRSARLLDRLMADGDRPLSPSEYYRCCLMVGLASKQLSEVPDAVELEGCIYPLDTARPLDAAAMMIVAESHRRGLEMSEGLVVDLSRRLIGRDGRPTRQFCDLMDQYCEGGFLILSGRLPDGSGALEFLRLCLVLLEQASSDGGA